MSLTLRIPSMEDAQHIQRIYAPYVRETVISFEETPPTISEMEHRLSQSFPTYPWIVAEVDQMVVGYAYATSYRPRAAYQWSVETSVYLDSQFFKRGMGHKLYTALLQILKEQGFFSVYAGIALPNPSSIRLHERFGFQHLGTYTRVGFKFNQWVDVGWWELKLQNQAMLIQPSPTKPLTELTMLSSILETSTL